MQCTTTGTVSRIAIRPEDRCRGAIQEAASRLPARRPVPTCTTANAVANVVSQALAYSALEKPTMSRANQPEDEGDQAADKHGHQERHGVSVAGRASRA